MLIMFTETRSTTFSTCLFIFIMYYTFFFFDIQSLHSIQVYLLIFATLSRLLGLSSSMRFHRFSIFQKDILYIGVSVYHVYRNSIHHILYIDIYVYYVYRNLIHHNLYIVVSVYHVYRNSIHHILYMFVYIYYVYRNSIRHNLYIVVLF